MSRDKAYQVSWLLSVIRVMSLNLPRQICVWVLVGFSVITEAYAQNYDSIIEQLVSKGVLTIDESNELKENADSGFNQAYAVKTGVPDWLNSLAVGGDMLVRYDGINSDNPTFVRQNFFSYRLRLGVTAKFQYNFESGIRLTSGDLERASRIRFGTDPISGQQIYENNASKKAIFIDLAYLKWSPVQTSEFTGSMSVGKIQNPFEMSDLIFDPDYTPEGFAQTVAYRINDRQSVRANFGAFVIDDVGSLAVDDIIPGGYDSYLFGGQVLHEVQWTKKLSTTFGVGWLAITHEENLSPVIDENGFPLPGTGTPLINGGNLRYLEESRRGQLVYGFSSFVFDFAATYELSTFPLYEGVFPVTGFAEMIHNTEADSDYSNGYQVGVRLGQAGRKGTWQISYAYKVAGGDAWWDQLVDSNFGAYYEGPVPLDATTTRDTLLDGVIIGPDGNPVANPVRGRGYQTGTNVRGNIISASYSPYDMLTLNITVYLTSLIQSLPPGSDSRTARVQLNATVLF